MPSPLKLTAFSDESAMDRACPPSEEVAEGRRRIFFMKNEKCSIQVLNKETAKPNLKPFNQLTMNN